MSYRLDYIDNITNKFLMITTTMKKKTGVSGYAESYQSEWNGMDFVFYESPTSTTAHANASLSEAEIHLIIVGIAFKYMNLCSPFILLRLRVWAVLATKKQPCARDPNSQDRVRIVNKTLANLPMKRC